MSVKNTINTADVGRRAARTLMFQINSAAASMVTIARELAPVDTGFMQANIRQTEPATMSNLYTSVESNADYSLFVEYGTVSQDAQPFMAPAYESAKRQLQMVRGVF